MAEKSHLRQWDTGVSLNKQDENKTISVIIPNYNLERRNLLGDAHFH